VHIRNASVSLKKKTTTAKELNYSPLPRSFNIFLNRITNLPEITDGVYTFFVNNSHVFVSVISDMQIQHVIACMFILLLPYFKEKILLSTKQGVPLL